MTEKQIPWEKCCYLTTDGATVMTGRFSGVGARVEAVATNCILKHYIIHREALAVKPLSSDKQRKTELESVLDIVVKTVDNIKCDGKGKSARVFPKLYEEIDSENVTVLLHTEVRWLFRGKVFTRVFKLRREISFFLQRKIMNMQRIFLTMNGSQNWHIWLQYSMCCPYSTPVFKGKVRIYFPKLEKLMPLKEKSTAGPIKCQKTIFPLFSF